MGSIEFENGQAHFQSFKQNIKLDKFNFGEIFQIQEADGYIWFIADEVIFRLTEASEKRSFMVIRPGDIIGGSFVYNNKIWFFLEASRNRPKAGFYTLAGNKYIPIKEENNDVWGVRYSIPLEAGQLIVTTDNKLFLYNGQQMKKMQGPTAAFGNAEVFGLANLPGNKFAMVFNHQGVGVFDANGHLLERYDNQSGLPSMFFYALGAAKSGALWIAHAKGVTYLNSSSPVRDYNLLTDNQGVIMDIYPTEKDVIIGTLSGIYRVTDKNIEIIKPDETYEFLEVGGSLLAATYKGVLEVRSSSGTAGYLPLASNLANPQAFALIPSAKSPENTCFLIQDGTILKLSKSAGAWHSSVIDKMPPDLNSVCETPDGNLWIGTDRGMVLLLSNDGKLQYFDSKQDLPEGKLEVIPTGKGQFIVYSKVKGYFRFNLTTRRFQKIPLKFGNTDYYPRFKKLNASQTAFFTANGTRIVRFAEDFSWSMDSINALFTIGKQNDRIKETNLYYWISSQEQLWRITKKERDESQGELQWARLIIGKDSIIQAMPASFTELSEYSISYAQNSLTISMTAGIFDLTNSVAYRFWLEGLDTEPGSWQSTPEIVFRHLREGNYTLHAWLRDPYGRISTAKTLSFHVAAPWYRHWLAYCCYAIAIGGFFYAGVRFRERQLAEQNAKLEQQVQERTAELVAEKKTSDDLLHNILPHETIEEIKATGKARPKRYEQVSIIFTDFKGFTQSCEKLSPEELVQELDKCFKAFDKIILKHRLEKIKTIGDAYMCAGGLPVPDKDSVFRCIEASLEIQNLMQQLTAENEAKGKPFWECRLGIHTGPVVAGVVGESKYAYDIWGDTVNTAARMESSGEVGKVNISVKTYELVKNRFQCTFRGDIEAKGKGKIGMYFVEKPITKS